MNNSDTPNPQGSKTTGSPVWGFAPRQWLKNKRISYLTLPLLVMATVTEFVILATGWKYQQTVCLPRGMGVTFFGIGPIGATILAVELLKLPLAIWTASRRGIQKGLMLVIGLPLICLLTFQLVKDMAVYEMGVALAPANQLFKEASAEEVKISQLSAELAGLDQKKAARDAKLADLAARKAKAKADLEESLKHNEEVRQDAISLTDYQKQELSAVESRQATIIKQFDADAAELTKTLAELHAQREIEVKRATDWNVAEARIDNAYKVKLAAYENEKAAYAKARAEYDSANILKRQILREPVDPGVPPVRESNPVLKPTTLAELDDQIKAKESELLAVNNKRRAQVAQVEADAHDLREQFSHRASTKRDDTDHKRDELMAAQAVQAAQWIAEEKAINEEYDAAAGKADGLRAEVDASRKQAEALYAARETAIQNTQVHRIATTVEIVRGLLFGQRPVTIKATAKERGDLYTDQISMVRIWVYPVLAFIVAFLPTLLVEIGFSTVFESEQARPQYRLGFFGRRLHWLYKRAGRQKILRAERLAGEAAREIALREEALATQKAAADQALSEKEKELAAAQAAAAAAVADRDARLQQQTAAHAAQDQAKEAEWVAKLAGLADSLNRTVQEKDALRDLQKSEIERQIQMRQNAWSDRVTQLRQELDAQRTASETERTTLMQEQQKKLLEVAEESKTQVIQARRQAAAAELAAVEATARLTHDLHAAQHARDAAESQLQQQAESLSLRLTQAKEDAAREQEKAVRQEKLRQERQQLEAGKALRQQAEDFAHQLKQREQELTLALEARLAEVQTRVEQESRRREADVAHQLETRAQEVEARWKQEVQQREEAAQTRLKQREQQWQAQAELRASEAQTQAEQEWRRRQAELERQYDARARETEARIKQEQQQQELAFQTKLKQREQELVIRAGAREAELQNQQVADLRAHQEEWERQAAARAQVIEARLQSEAQQKEELAQAKARQRDQQWQAKLDSLRTELQAQTKEVLRQREAEAEIGLRELEAQLRKEQQQQQAAAQALVREREQELEARLAAQAEAAAAQAELTAEKKVRAAVEPLKAQLARTAKERDDARQAAADAARREQSLEKKLTEASTFLNGWRHGGVNGNGNGKVNGNGNGNHLAGALDA